MSVGLVSLAVPQESRRRCLSAVSSATTMVDARPAAKSRVPRPTMRAIPPTSSRLATKAALAWGKGMPSSVKKVTVLSKWAHLPLPVR